MDTNILTDLFDELVPASGASGNVAGEAVRAANRIAYRYFNDGDHIGDGYGKETCNPAARFLIAETNDEIAAIVNRMWGVAHDPWYEEALEELCWAVRRFVEADFSLRAKTCRDMWDYATDEDVDDDGDDDDEDDYGW